jgi:hypothetical protein
MGDTVGGCVMHSDAFRNLFACLMFLEPQVRLMNIVITGKKNCARVAVNARHHKQRQISTVNSLTAKS